MKLPEYLTENIIAAIRAGKTCRIIHAEMGIPESTIRYTAAKYGLILTSRYVRVRPAMYWNSRMGAYWRSEGVRLPRPVNDANVAVIDQEALSA